MYLEVFMTTNKHLVFPKVPRQEDVFITGNVNKL